MDLRQTIKLTQKMVMTPQLQQAIKLLQLGRLELIETINEEMEVNPALEEYSETVDPSAQEQEDSTEKEKNADEVTENVSSIEASEKDIDWEQYIESYSANDYSSAGYENETLPSYDNIIRNKDTLADHLLWQLQLSSLDARSKMIGEFIIGNIDDAGYLIISPEEIAESTDITEDEFEEVLRVVQEFDPPGIAARDLKECLLAQSRLMGLQGSIVDKIIKNHLPDIEARRLSRISRITGETLENVQAAVKVISEMEPRPGRPFSDDNTQYITPDLYLYKIDGEYVIVQNEEGIPKLRIGKYYRNMISNGACKAEAKEYAKDKVRSALWLIRSIQQRLRTIYKVMESILKFQRDFFDYGVEHLKPLVLKDVAEDIGMHESTISRVTNNKYVHTPQGLFELKFFFNSAINRFGEDDIASESVKEKIRNLIKSEDCRKPLSDKAIVGLLEQSNIDIARRTVAKYREVMGIASSSKRKKLF